MRSDGHRHARLRCYRLASGTAIALSVVIASPLSADARSSQIVDKLKSGATERVSVSSSGAQGDSHSGRDCSGAANQHSASDNGRFVTFTSVAGNLHPNDTNGRTIPDVFVYDRSKDQIELVSALPTGLAPELPPSLNIAHCQSTFGSFHPVISGNGRYIAFTSNLPLVGDAELFDLTPVLRVYVRDLKKGTTELVSRTWNGDPPDGDSGCCSGHGFGVSISDDGRWVTFTSDAKNIVQDSCAPAEIVPGVSDPLSLLGCQQVYAHDRANDKTVLVSKATDDMPARYESYYPSISGNGRYVSFATNATSGGIALDCDPTRRGCADVFVHDLRSGKTELVSFSRDGQRPANGPSGVWVTGSQISDDGRYVTFRSSASDLVPANHRLGLVNGSIVTACSRGQYVRDRKTDRIQRVSVTSTGSILHEYGEPQLSDDGRYAIFRATSFHGSCLDNATDRENVYIGDFIQDTETGQVDWVSCDGTQWFGHSGEECPKIAHEAAPEIGGNGRFLLGAHGDDDVVAGDSNSAYDIFVRDLGRYPLGTGPLEGAPPKEPEPDDDEICIVPDLCIQPSGAVVSLAQGSSGADGAGKGAELYGASIAYRPELRDLFVSIEVEHMGPAVTGAAVAGVGPSLLYGLNLEVDHKRYEVRASSLLGGTFGLFDCTSSAPLCTRVASLEGGYGTTGERVVFSLPLEEVGLSSGGELKHVEAFSAIGSHVTGAVKVLDSVLVGGR